MFCPSCGLAVVSGLRFCNHCGARIATPGPEMEPKQLSPAILVAAMTFLFVFGLVAISLLTVFLADGVHLKPGQIMGFAGFAFLLLAALEAVFITLLFRGKRRTKEPKQADQLHPPKMEEPRALSDRGAPLPSVTEHTTRAFDYIPKQPSKELN